MKTADFTTTILVDKTPDQVYQAVNNVRGWWSENIDGPTDQLNAEFIYRYKDIHYCKIKVTELVPGRKVVWQVLDNYFQFTKDKSEWTGTKIVFEITSKGDSTSLRFTHQGLVHHYECYEVCREAWTNYIKESLYGLITTGKGQPNSKEDGSINDFTVSITVDATPDEAFDGINDVAKWWTENVEGGSEKPGDEFTVRFGDVHVSTQKLVEVVPDKKVVWLVTDSKLNFVENKHEWTGTKIVFEISVQGGKTQIRFTHQGLVPAFQCYGGCSGAWGEYITGSLYKLLTEGKGMPEVRVK